LRRNPYRLSTVISSAYGVNFYCMLLDKILYETDKNDTLYNYCNLFYHPSYKEVQRLTPSVPQDISPYSKENKVMDLRMDCSTLP